MTTTSDIERRKQRAALVSVAVKLVLTLAKFGAALASGSLALASEAGNNLGDVAVTLLSFYSIRVAAQPADAEHPFGHGKVEALSALVQTGFLFALALFILIEAVKRLIAGNSDVEPTGFAYAILVVSIAVDFVRWLSLRKVARETRSAALAADALNFATDIVASALALLGLVAASFGFAAGDAIAAVSVAVFVAFAGLQLGRETVDTLLDAAPRGLTDPLRRAIEGVPGVMGVDMLRLRPTGSGIAGEAVVRVPRTLSLERVATITEAVRATVARHQGEHGEATMMVRAEPVALDDETVVERVLLIANRRHVPIHHVTVQTVDACREVNFDAEIDSRLTLGRSHEVVTALEQAIGDELGAGFAIESHIEPLEMTELAGRDCDDGIRSRIAAALAERAPETGVLAEVHDVRVRETAAGLVVNYHCLADPDLSVHTVHEHVDGLDRKIREQFRDVVRIIGHAEPLRAAL